MADEASSSSPSLPVGIVQPPPMIHEAGIPLHVHIDSGSPVSVVETGDQHDVVQGRKRRRTQTTLVAVRICPLRSVEKSSAQRQQQQPCIKAIQAQSHESCDQASPSRGGRNQSTLNSSAPQQGPTKGRIRSPKFLLSSSRKILSQRSGIFENDKDAEKVISRSLICGTENKMRFDFDQVVGPTMSQEMCYQRTVGDVIGRNITSGADTTIVVLGHKKSGKTYTMTGVWDISKKAAPQSGSAMSSKLTAQAGILPRAVHHLFEACQNLSGEYESTISMSFYMVACEGGRTRDLLMRFRDKANGAKKGITFVPVKSPQGVKRLMDRVSKRRASDVREGKTFHVFSSFRIALTYHDRVDSRKEDACETISSTITFVNLLTPSTLRTDFSRKPDDGGYNLRDLLYGVSSPKCNILNRRLDEVLLDVTSTIIVGCVSPFESEVEHSTDLLQLVAMATRATYTKEPAGDSDGDDRSEESMAEGSTVLEPGSLSTPDPGSVISSLQSTLHQAEQAAKGARESSESLDAAATKWRSHRRMLSRESTLAAIAQMKSLTGPNIEAKINSSFRRKVGPMIKSGRKETAEQVRRHDSKLIVEKELMKSQIGKLKKECRSKDTRIKSLQDDLVVVNNQLAEEKQITGKLEDIRNILKRKATLQDKRIQILERELTTALTLNENRKNEISSIESRHDDKHEVEGKVDEILVRFEKDRKPRLDETNEMQQRVSILQDVVALGEGGGAGNNLLSFLDESFGEASVFLPGDDADSSCSKYSTKSSQLTIDHLETTDDVTLHRETKESNKSDDVSSGSGHIYISNANAVEQQPLCPCQKSLLASGYDKQIEFYLPKLNISCLCGKQQRMLPYCTELGRLSSILRPWQATFLASLGIIETEEFINAYRKREKKLATRMVNWRATKRLRPMPKHSCAAALLIWSRSCSTAMRLQRSQELSVGGNKT